MESNIVNEIINKINNHNLGLLSEYTTEDKGHCFVTRGMIIFLDEEDDILSVSFQADQRPEDAARNTLILKELQNVKKIKIMESFVYDRNNNYICGDEAHEIVKQSIITQAFQSVAKQKAYKEILENSQCFEC